MGSISFDRAADTYDATRALPDAISNQMAATLAAEMERAGASRALELGIGTGRIARPLAARGVRVTGLDISPLMMAQLRAQQDAAAAPIDLLLGDATRLPLRDGSFRAVLMVHVLHLVSSWQATLDETARVLQPGGVFLHDVTHYSKNNPWQRVFAKREEILATLGFTPRARPSDDDIASRLAALGATRRRIVYAERDDREVAREVIDRGRNRVDSWTWEIPDEIFPAFFAQYEAHASETLGGLDATNVTHVEYGLDVWSFA